MHAAPFRLLVVLLGLGLIGCSSAGSPATSAPAPAPEASRSAAPGPGATAPTSAPALQKIQMTYPGQGMCCIPIFIARDRGMFHNNGLDVETLLMTSDRAMAAVASGELHYVGGVGTASVAAAALGLPIRAAWISASSPPYTIFSRPEIRSVEQLKGKRAGIPGFGGTSAVAMSLALKHHGIDSASEMVVLQIGADELLYESLRSGVIDVTPLTAPLSLQARADGFVPLIDVASVVRMPLGGLSISLEKLNHDADQARRVIRSLDQAQQWFIDNRDEAVAVIMEALKTDRATAEGTYDEALPTYLGKGLVEREGIENTLQIVRDAGRIGPDVRYEDVADGRLAMEVARELGLVR